MNSATVEDRFDLAEVGTELDADQVQRQSAYKTVEAFGGITKRRLWLKDGQKPYTDGHEVCVPLGDPAAYKLLGHQLAHILFQTNPHARKLFIEEYVKRIAELVEKNGKPLAGNQQAAFAQMLEEIINAIECHRVESLWGLLYSGSYKFGRTLAREEAEELLPSAHETFAQFLSVLEAGCDPPSGRFDRFRPYIVEAFRKSERRGPSATLIVSKWLITHMVSEILREARNEPPPPDAQLPDLLADPPAFPEPKQDQPPGNNDAQKPPDTSDLDKSDAEGESVGGADQAPEEDQEGKEPGESDGPGKKSEHAPKDGEAKGQSDEVGDPDPDGTPGSGKWTPPKTDASQQERADALKKLIDQLGRDPSKQKPGRFNDVKDPPAPEKGAAQAAAQMASEALKTDVGNQKALQGSLDASRNAMDEQVERARNAFRQQMTHDDWLRRDSHAKVVFRDVKPRDVLGMHVYPLSAEDQLTIQKLRGLFNRVMGKRRLQLEETGTEIDVPALIERRVTGANIPVFRHEVRGQGFKPLILIDRSGSMGGDKQIQSERACRIIARALRYPFVDLHIWGFQSLANGQVDIVRFDPKVEVFDTDKSRIAGVTPFHLAIRVAHRFLERGTEMKHLFAVTDGFPVYSRKDGQSFSTKQLIMLVREEVHAAKVRGIATTGAIIGSSAMLYNDQPGSAYFDLGPRELKFMFGAQRFWKQIHPQTFGNDLVRLVSASFIDYLKSG